MTTPKTLEAVIAALDALTDADPEEAHQEADSLLVAALSVPTDGIEGVILRNTVVAAYERARERIEFWYG